MISVIIPVLNEANRLPLLLASLAPLRAAGHEVLVVDGGSGDGTPGVAAPLCDRVIESQRGRARQMNRGAAEARGDLLWFVHADVLLTPAVLEAIQVAEQGQGWGRFEVRLSGRSPWFRIIEWFMNRRSCLTGICTGDQALYISRVLFERVGGFPEIGLMEDIAISKNLRRLAAPTCCRERLLVSSRLWERRGIFRTVLLMWLLRLRYFFGADPERLRVRYYGG